MAQATLSIGGHTVILSGGSSVDMAMSLPGMKVFECAEAEVSMQWHLDSVIAAMECRWIHEFDVSDGAVHCRFGVDAQGGYHYDFGSCGRLHYMEGDGVYISPMSNASVMRFALWTAFAMMGMAVGAVPVHSSVVVCEGKAVMCLGESGTGKSTHTRLWLENIDHTHLLNDDSPIIAIHGDKVRVYGSPWSGKTHCYRQESFPIAGLLRLEQRKENTIRRLRVLEAFAALQPSCPPSMAKDEHCLDLLVQFISNVIEHVPVYRMGCLPNAEAAQLSHETLMPWK
ncbi:MAG: hypothetical protein IJ745_03920 [Bacteroidales bacterium]|nr:hypothetical protein [Bacteroidales bacterium]